MELLYGFHQLADLVSTPAINVDRGLLISAIQMSSEQHNQAINNLLGLFSGDTTDYKVKFNGAVVTKNQPLDENGRTKPIKLGLPYDTAFPIFTSGNAWGMNFVTSAKMTVEKLNDLTSVLLEGDARYVRYGVLAALFNSTNGGRTFIDPQYGTLQIVGLANGDTVKYIKNGSEAPATDTHYLAQANAIDDTHDPFKTLYTALMEHPENAGLDIVTFIASDLKDTTTDLGAFVPVGDPKIALGANAAQIIGTLGITLPATAKLLGRHENQWIVEWPAIPSGYMLSLVIGASEPVLKRRQDAEAMLQGFKPVAQRSDFPYFDEQWFRRCGFGGWNRIRAAAMRIGDAAWAIPAGYDAFEP